jgi:alkanesulfonate monooxygenase SsuD/methylene tetrahydromethanopterin reductase-like flavin-dependent oxidoreductase (luciferase family)
VVRASSHREEGIDLRVEFFVYLPQMRLSLPDLISRARAAEDSTWDGMAFMDHLAPPLAEAHNMYEAMTTVAWVAAHTQRLRLGHLGDC